MEKRFYYDTEENFYWHAYEFPKYMTTKQLHARWHELYENDEEDLFHWMPCFWDGQEYISLKWYGIDREKNGASVYVLA